MSLGNYNFTSILVFMKKAILLILGLGLSFVLFAQQTRGQGSVAPELVSEKFQSEFPKAMGINWEKKGNRYEATFSMNGFRMYALYTSAGLWLHTVIDVPMDRIPEDALIHYKKFFADFKILKTGFFDSPGGSYYTIIVQKNNVKRVLKYNEHGSFLEG